MSDPIVRPAARLVILDARRRILLQRIRHPHGHHFWITPGGGIDDGEAPEDAALREATEELGLSDLRLGPLIWTRRHVFNWDGTIYDQREVYFLVHVDTEINAASTYRPLPAPEDVIVEHRWWSADEITAAAIETAPRGLERYLADLIENGPPAVAIDVGV